MRIIHCSKCHSDLPVEAFPPSLVRPKTKKQRCNKCAAAATRAWAEANPEKAKKPRDRRDYNAASYAANRERRLARARQYRIDHPERASASVHKYQDANRERMYAVAAVWRQKNPAIVRARTAARRACRIQRTPLWADLGAIRAIYEECQRKSEATGILHHVDHIIPLRGKNVCGLHVAENLQIIPASLNLRKNNKFEEAAY